MTATVRCCRYASEDISHNEIIVMKTITCECGHTESGASEKDVLTKMTSHIHNEHGDRSEGDMKKMLRAAEKTMAEGEPVASEA